MRASLFALAAFASVSAAATCPANHYSGFFGGCSDCPDGATSPAGSTSSSQCICPAGSSLSFFGGECECNDPNAIPITLASGALLCSPGCPAGQGLNMQTGTCSICPAGQASNGKSACAACPRNSFSSAAGSSSCSPCPSNSNTNGATGSSTCKCTQAGRYFGNLGAGYSCNQSCPGGSAGANGVCSLCSSGSVSSGAAGSSCTQCVANTYANSAATSCTACPAFSTSSRGSTTCSCMPGYRSSGSGSTLICTLNASGGVQAGKRKDRKRKYSPAELVFRVDADNSHLCPTSTTACPLGKQGGFECLNLKEELHACGSCRNDCTKMPGVRATRCEQGICVVSACKTGFTHFVDANADFACRRV